MKNSIICKTQQKQNFLSDFISDFRSTFYILTLAT